MSSFEARKRRRMQREVEEYQKGAMYRARQQYNRDRPDFQFSGNRERPRHTNVVPHNPSFGNSLETSADVHRHYHEHGDFLVNDPTHPQHGNFINKSGHGYHETLIVRTNNGHVTTISPTDKNIFR